MRIDSVSKSTETAIRAELAATGLLSIDAPWRALSGGRTNAIWKIGDGTGAIVCKLYRGATDSPLFPNDPEAEASALSALAGTGLAPELIAAASTSLGPCLLYRHVEGCPFTGDPADVAEALARLHRQDPPWDLRRIQSGAVALRQQGHAILKDCSGHLAKDLLAVCPDGDHMPDGKPVFLHGDLVPANIVNGPAGLTLIDWQCPGIGDPSEDLATFLSPAMQSLYGGQPLSIVEESRFLELYGNSAAVRSYRSLKPLFHWRMAAHCLWKAERGSQDYGEALKLELAELKQG